MLPTSEPPAVSFLGLPVQTDLSALAADFAILGARYGVPYDIHALAAGPTTAPAAVRQRSVRYGAMRGHFDFDTNGAMLPEALKVVDCGDVAADPNDMVGNKTRVTAAVRTILERGATPIVLGGDDSIAALVLAAYEASGPITVLQIDAHLDFRDEVRGIRDGFSSPMRRASEMPWVDKIVHVGIRGVGSAREQDVADTLAAGNVIISARELREQGVARVLREFPEGGRYFVTLDCDGFDPSVMPGTGALMPAGMSYREGADLLLGLAQRGQVVGFDHTEYFPGLDVNGVTSLGLVRLIVTLMAASGAAASR